MSASMPLLLHNWKEIADLWVETFKGSDDESLPPLLEYVYLKINNIIAYLLPQLAFSRN